MLTYRLPKGIRSKPMIDRIDIEEIEDDEAQHRADARRVAEHNADSKNDDAVFDALDAPIVAYTARLLSGFDAWARGVK